MRFSVRQLSVIIIGCFIAVAIFGFLAIGTPGCIASIANGGVCSSDFNAFDMAAFEVTSFKGFSTFILQQSALMLLIVVTMSLVVIPILFSIVLHVRYFIFQFLILLFFSAQQKISAWFCLRRGETSLA